jgi:hypothetical protein
MRLFFALCLLLAACGSQPAELRAPTPGGTPGLTSEPNAARVTIHGEARDAVSLQSLPSAVITITTTVGANVDVLSFTGSYSLTVPGFSVVEFHAESPGYRPLDFQIKPHYEHDVSIDGPLNMQPGCPPPCA